jgi:hypothetical protein
MDVVVGLAGGIVAAATVAAACVVFWYVLPARRMTRLSEGDEVGDE